MNPQPSLPAKMSNPQVARLQIRGKVQGVYYRASMVNEALRLGVAGWVRNRLDGSVEAMVCGSTEQVEQLMAWARRGPPAAAVTEVVVTPGEGTFVGFVQRPTA